MAGSGAVWGIDIGQCSLKAIRCRPGDSPGQLIADAFDYIAYPKILSQPGAEPADLVADALKQFLSRNSVRGDRVAIAVPGHKGLTRFPPLPPVEAKKIPSLVRYEAQQQIPFDLADVIWDYQRMGGGTEEEGFALETMVCLVAMKRDQVYRALQPFTDAGIEVEIIQFTHLALYNYLLFDRMQDLPPIDQYDPDDPPPSTGILSLGTDATDLVVTNGYRVWQRNIPLGGNHFTKALTKELKLTFAKAEHLKCNAAAAPDPRALFQAMRPVFNDLLTEIQRSIGYFTSIDRRAKIEKMVVLGNAMKMPGLRRYLSQSLSIEVERIESFEHLEGAEVLGAPAFNENLLSFGVAYGLAVQALGEGRGTLTTNLLPPEIVKDRFIRGKKPWALVGVALLLLACAIGYGTHSMALGSVAEKKYSRAEGKMKAVISRSGDLEQQATEAKTAFETAHETGQHLVGNVENRIRWLELLRAINEALPPGESLEVRAREGKNDPTKLDITEWEELHIESIDAQRMENVADWWSAVKDKYRSPSDVEVADEAGPEATPPTTPEDGTTAAAPVAGEGTEPVGSTDETGGSGEASAGESGPQGQGWIIVIRGHHFHNPPATSGKPYGAQHVRRTLISNLEEKDLLLPAPKDEASGDGEEKKEELVTMKELGISYPTLTWEDKLNETEIPDPFGNKAESGAKKAAPTMAGPAGPAGPMGPGGIMGGAKDVKMVKVQRFNFEVQFCWQHVLPTERAAKRKEQQQPNSGGADDE